MFIYPVTNYLVSPKRQYARWKGAIYAMSFLFLISGLHIMYENREKGLNYHQLLEVSRGSPASVLKKNYRDLSLKLHPDKVLKILIIILWTFFSITNFTE